MLIQRTAFTAGITKKGEISKTRTMPRPGKVLLIKTAIKTPRMTVRNKIEQTISRLF